MNAAFRNGFLSVLSGAGWSVTPHVTKERRHARAALRHERVSTRYAFGTTSERLGHAYESEKARATGKA